MGSVEDRSSARPVTPPSFSALAERLFERSPDRIDMFDLEGRLEYTNRNNREAPDGVDRHESSNGSWLNLWDDPFRQVAASALHDASLGRPTRFEGWFPAVNGTQRRWDVVVSPITEDSGRVARVLAISRDISREKLTLDASHGEEALRESEERFRLIANTAPVIIWMSDVSKACTYVNQTWLDLTGQSSDGVLGNGWTDRIHPEDVGQCWDAYARAFDRRELVHLDFRLRRRDDEYRWIVSTGTPRYHGDGSFAGYIGSAIDVTERRLAAAALATIDQRLIDAHEEERSRIARELHDDISQRLAVLSITLDGLVRAGFSPASGGSPQLEEARDEMLKLANDVQALSHRLHPARLELLGLTKAAAALCREISIVRVLEIPFSAENIPDDLPKRVALCLYRVLQEALQNASKHTGGEKVEVSLRGGADQIELTVRDFGAGFDVSIVQGRGLGLTSMTERVRAVGGRLTILSEPQRGTTVHASVPVG